MSGALVDWLYHASLALCFLIPAAWLIGTVLRRWSGARAAYAAWLVVLPGLLPPLQFLPPIETLPPLIVTPVPIGGWALPEAAARIPVDWSTWLISLWLSGALVMAVRLAWQQQRFTRVLEAQYLDARQPSIRLLRKVGIPSWIPVRVTEACRSPMVVGWLPPKLYVPPRLDNPEPILAHEASHLRHGDPFWTALATGLRCLFWFHPLIHLLWFRLRRDQELAADERVICQFPAYGRLEYAQLLCRTVGIIHPPLGHAWPGTSSLKERIKMISKSPRSNKSVVAGLIVVIIATLIAGWSVAQDRSVPGERDRHSEELVEAKASLMEFVESDVLNSEALQPVVRINPKYPSSAAEAGVTGYVVMQATLTENGEVTAIQAIEAEPEGVFEAEAVQAFSRWRFVPVTDEETGLPKRRKIKQKIEFKLDVPLTAND